MPSGKKRRELNSGKSTTIRAAPFDPEAVVQPRKDGVFGPAYKPSMLVDEHRFIVGQFVTPSSEQEALHPLFEQYLVLHRQLPPRVLMDGGYRDAVSLKFVRDRNIDALCNLGRMPSKYGAPLKMRAGQFDKSAFTYEAERDEYTCPEGRRLVFRQNGVDYGLPFRRYKGIDCEKCPSRKLCVKGKQCRLLKRYESDALQEAMAEKLAAPQAQAEMKKRGRMVELGYADLKERLGLRRFRRCGLEKARMEFALACLAYNIGRALGWQRRKVIRTTKPPSGAAPRRP